MDDIEKEPDPELNEMENSETSLRPLNSIRTWNENFSQQRVKRSRSAEPMKSIDFRTGQAAIQTSEVRLDEFKSLICE